MIWVFFRLFFSTADSVTKQLIARHMGYAETPLQRGEKLWMMLNWMLGKELEWPA